MINFAGMGQIGNRFWELRGRHGRLPKYEDPNKLLENICDYFEQTSCRTDWNKQNWVGKEGIEVVVNVTPPFTKSGLYIFLGISDETWRQMKKKNDFVGVITWAEDVMYTQKLEGAATGHYNSNIIAAELGLKNKQEIEMTDKRESVSKLFPDELDQ